MRILQLLSFPLHGCGSGNYVRKLSLNLKKLGHDLAIVCPDNRELTGIRIYEAKLPFMAVFTGHPEHPKAKQYSKLTGSELNKIQSAFMKTIIVAVEDFQPDVIHVHHASNLSWVANYIRAVYQINFIITSHNTDIINAILDKRYIPLTQDALRRAEIITAVSKSTRQKLLDILGKRITNLARKTKVVYVGVDAKNFPHLGPVDEVNKLYKLSDKKVVLYSGKITAIKGVDIFIRAAAKFPEVNFVIMGDGDEINRMKQLVRNDKIDNVIFTGYLGEKKSNIVSQLYRRADMIVVPSTVSEGIPMSLLEGMAAGNPVIGSNIGGISTVIRNMKNGILIKPKSVSALVEAIAKLFDNPKLAKKMAEVARRDVLVKFDWKAIAKKMEKYYLLAIERSKKNRVTKKASFVTEEEYSEKQKYVEKVRSRYKS